MDFEVLIIGSDANAYHMARSTHEAYNKKAYLIASTPLAFTKFSNILNIKYVENLWDEKVFINELNEFYEKHSDKKILLISSNERYASYILKHEKELSKKFYFNYPSLTILNNFIMKDLFYNDYHNDLNLPKTYIYSCKKKNVPSNDFLYPVIVKPSDVIEYGKNKNSSWRKIYKLYSYEDVLITIANIEEMGYNENILIQEFIPGDDSALFDCVFYCSKEKKAILSSFAQIGLQDHNKRMIGNATVLINGFNEHNDTKKVLRKLKDFMEKIGYQGFAEFDLKYDYRDKTYKVLEINARQGRSSYYLTACGYNLVKYLVDDLLVNKPLGYTEINERLLLTFVPKGIIKKYIKNEAFRNEALSLYKEKKVVNPLFYNKDKHIKRLPFLLMMAKKSYESYKNSDWDNED